MRIRIVDAADFERQPAAVTREVCQELHVIGRSAQAGNVGAVLFIMRISHSLVHHLLGGHRLNLVQLRCPQFVYFLHADKDEFRQRKHIVFGNTVIVGLDVKIALQRRRQQLVEPGRLVAALRPDQYENLVVHRFPVKEGGNGGYEPFLEVTFEYGLLALYVHRGGKPPDMVGHTVPGFQPFEVVGKRIEQNSIFRVQYCTDVIDAHGFSLLAHTAP